MSTTSIIDCWAVGEYQHAISTTGRDILNLALRWNGTTWATG